MLNRIPINHDKIYFKANDFTNRISSIIRHMEEDYRQFRSMLDGMDGATAAALKKTMEANRRKMLKTAKIMEKR